MSSGYVHNTVSLATAGVGFLVAIANGVSVESSALLAAGCLLGIILTPDLDQPTYNRIENKWRNSSNPLIAMTGMLYVALWMPYAYMIPHRSWASHTPIVGTALRILYILVVLSIIMLLVGMFVSGWHDMIPALWAWIPNNFEQLSPLIYGLALSDFMHWVLDWKMFRFLNRRFGL